MIRSLQSTKLELEERIVELEGEICSNSQIETKKDLKTYSNSTRMMVYDSLTNQVPTQNIPNLMESHCKRTGHKLSTVPHRSTVEQMARELNVIADLKVAEMALKTKNLTLGFDATTQEGVHINSIHLTSKYECEVVAIDELPGGTGDDYCEHVCSSIHNIADTYASFHEEEVEF